MLLNTIPQHHLISTLVFFGYFIAEYWALFSSIHSPIASSSKTYINELISPKRTSCNQQEASCLGALVGGLHELSLTCEPTQVVSQYTYKFIFVDS